MRKWGSCSRSDVLSRAVLYDKQILFLQPTLDSPASIHHCHLSRSPVDTAYIHKALFTHHRPVTTDQHSLIGTSHQSLAQLAARDATKGVMADSDADAAPRKKIKLSNESHTGRQKVDVGASEEVSRHEGPSSGNLEHNKKLVSMRGQPLTAENDTEIAQTAEINAAQHSKKKSSGVVSEDNSEQGEAVYGRQIPSSEADSVCQNTHNLLGDIC